MRGSFAFPPYRDTTVERAPWSRSLTGKPFDLAIITQDQLRGGLAQACLPSPVIEDVAWSNGSCAHDVVRLCLPPSSSPQRRDSLPTLPASAGKPAAQQPSTHQRFLLVGGRIQKLTQGLQWAHWEKRECH